jgi:hypothetical protein
MPLESIIMETHRHPQKAQDASARFSVVEYLAIGIELGMAMQCGESQIRPFVQTPLTKMNLAPHRRHSSALQTMACNEADGQKTGFSAKCGAF